MKRWICLFLVMSSSLAHPNDREHGDFYRGLTGLKAQIDEINRDLILLENATLSSSEVNRRLARIEQQIDDAYKKISEASDAELRELSAQELEQVKRSLQVLNM